MLTTRLVQRLKAPLQTTGPLDKLSRVFGGGNLGLTEAAYNLVNQAFDFDYMGAAEYEFGAVRETLSTIVQNSSEYRAFDFVIRAKDIVPGWWRRSAISSLRAMNQKRLEAKAAASPIVDRTIYVLCREGTQVAVEGLIRRIASKDRNLYIKGGTRMASALDPDPRFGERVCGWLDLDNNIAWFLSREMRDATAHILGIY